MALEIKRFYVRKLLNGYREVVFGILGAEDATQEELDKCGPQIGDIDSATGLKVTSRNVMHCTSGKGPRGHISDSLAKFAGVIKPAPPWAPGVQELRKRTAAKLAKYLGVTKLNLDGPPAPRQHLVKLHIWYQPAVLPQKRGPWKNRVKPATKKDVEEYRELTQ